VISEQDPPTPASLTPVRRVQVVRVESGRRVPSDDNAAAEEPLDVRLHGRSFATIMRTPGDDRALAAGFLYAERVVRSSDEIGAVEHCRHPDRGEVHHVVDVFLRGEAAQSAQRHLDERRHVVANSSCGICGRTSIAELRAELTPIDTKWSIEPAIIHALPDTLRARQSRFEQTGGLHAAGLFDRQAACLLSCEDVGRHNAVDKVIGQMLLDDRLPLTESMLMVSGRVSFEIVQKAWTAGIPLVAAVSAPTSLAIDLAHEAGITLLAFVRGRSFNIYAHSMRVAGP
jgi:FdhD protein